VSLLLLLSAGLAGAVTVVINFDDLANGVVVTNQYPEATFSSTPDFGNLTTAQSLGSSQPNFICTASPDIIDCEHETIVDFTNPVSNLTFLEVGDSTAGTNALIDVFVNGIFAATVNAVGDGDPFAIERYARELIDLHRRRVRAMEHLRAARELLSGQTEPASGLQRVGVRISGGAMRRLRKGVRHVA
jgi:hypothetical protein